MQDLQAKIRGKNIRTIIVTDEQIAKAVAEYPRNQINPNLEHRAYIADRFFKEHGCTVLDFTKLRYVQSACQKAIRVDGAIGIALSAPVA